MKQFSGAFVLKTGLLAGLFLALPTTKAADVTAFSAAKGRLYVQTSATGPAPQLTPYVFRATTEGNLAAISEATVQGPSIFGVPFPLSPNSDGTRLEFALPFTGLTEMSFLFGDGAYRFTFDTDSGVFDFAEVTLTGTAFPTAIPQISNFDAAQSVNAANDFTLNFNAQGDANGGYVLTISGPNGEVLLEKGTGTSVVIAAGTLSPDESYTARLRFAKELDRDTDSIPGAVGTAELFNETEFSIETGEGGGGGEDTTPPVLFRSNPTNGATGIGTNAVVSFEFNEEMRPTQSIEWSANVNPALFAYAWTSGGRTLVATYGTSLPASSIITWRLNPAANSPTNFADLAGNELFAGFFQGTFTTGTGSSTNDPCANPGNDGRGFGSVIKNAYYVQTDNNTPVLDTEQTPSFTASYRGASNQTVTAVSVSGPAGVKNLEGVFGFYILNEEHSSVAALDTAVPAGTYTITATGAGTANVNLGTVAELPIPQIGNLSALQSMDVTRDFVLTFNPFTGASGNDGIFISIFGGQGDGQFQAPDLCRGIELPVTATSVVIPANSFKAGKEFSGSISFFRSSFNTNAIPNTSISGGSSVTTQFEFTSGGSQPIQPRWTSSKKNADGTLTFTLTATAGAQVTIEQTTDFAVWTGAQTATLTGPTYDFVVDPRSTTRRIYRARVP